MSDKSGRLAEKVALITGAARGQGLAMAQLFRKEGCRVVLCDILEQGAEEAGKLGEGAAFFPLDVTSEERWAKAVAFTVEAFGKLNILANNAGMIIYRPLADTRTEDYRTQFEIDQLAVFFGMRAAYPALKSTGNASVVNTASTAGLLGLPTMGAYAAAKQAVCAMTRVAAAEWGRDGIRVNTIIPGAIRTKMLSDFASEDQVRQIAADTPLNRVGEPEDIARLALFLASDESAYCTGADFFCDGGMHIVK